MLKLTHIRIIQCGLLLFMLLLNGNSRAQIPTPMFKSLSQEDGLTQGINAYVKKDSKGFIWISSLDGINRFDGKTIKPYLATSEGGSANSSDNLVSGNFFV